MDFFKIAFKNSFVYRSSIIFSVLGSIFNILLILALWVFVYQYDNGKISYMITYTILSNCIGLFYSNKIGYAIARQVISGDFALALIKPVNFLAMHYYQMLGNICSSFLMRGLSIIAIFMPLLIANAAFNSPAYILFALIAVVLGHILYTILYALIGFMAFTFLEIWPFARLMDDTIRFLSGAFIPLALFPEWLGGIAEILPFRFMYSFPLQLLIGEITPQSIAFAFFIFIGWITILGTLLISIYNKAIARCTVQGG